MKPQKYNGPKQPAFKQATDLLARTAAIAVTFFGTGPAFAATETGVRDFVAGAYGVELAGLASLLWFGILAVSIFSFATLFIAALVQIVGIKVTQLAFKSR